MLTVGCAPGDMSTSAAAIADSAGITIVTNTAPAWTAESAWHVADSPTIDIGVVAGDAAYEFFRPLGAVRLSDGRIVVANRGTVELRYFDKSGKQLVTAGGEGGGPGEMMDMSWFSRTVGDSMVVYDRRNRRLSVFDPQGVYDHSVRLQTSEFPFMKVGWTTARMWATFGGDVPEGLHPYGWVEARTAFGWCGMGRTARRWTRSAPISGA